MSISNLEIDKKIEAIKKKYGAMGQELSDSLDGLLYSRTLNYWEYLNLDALLSLQSPKTHYADEYIFITYHQIVELYFNLILREIRGLQALVNDEDNWLLRLDRINRYYRQIITSFDVMLDGLDREQFVEYRKALLPASGFQSVQYRQIEMHSTELINLVADPSRSHHDKGTSIAAMYSDLYWKFGNIDKETQSKAQTLVEFEKYYDELLLSLAKKNQGRTIGALFESSGPAISQSPRVIELLREFDRLANLKWRLKHYRNTEKFLNHNDEMMHSTGGTNWQTYLPPGFQKIWFFPNLWSEDEKKHWGVVKA